MEAADEADGASAGQVEGQGQMEEEEDEEVGTIILN